MSLSAAAGCGCLSCSLNLETMQPAAPSEDLWSQIVSSAGLSDKQRTQVVLAFECYRGQRASLLQEQAQTIQQLQTLLGLQQPAETPGVQDGQQQPQAQQPGSGGPGADAAAPATDSTAAGAPAAAAAAAAVSAPSAGLSSAPEDTSGNGESAPSSVVSTGVTAAAVASGSGGGAAAAAAPAADSKPSPAASCAGSSAAPSLLDLDAAELADELLNRLQRNIKLQREYSRRLVYLWMDLLSTSQHAAAILCAYPFSIKIPAVCSFIWQQEQDRKQQDQDRKQQQRQSQSQNEGS